MRVAGVAEAVLVEKWGKRLESIANHCKHSVITEEDVDLLFAHDPDFIARVDALADSYDDPVDELAVADKKPKTNKPGSRESTKSPAAVRATLDEDEDEGGDEEEDVGPVTSPEPVVRVAIGPKTVVRVPSFGDSTKPSSSMTSPKPVPPATTSPFSKPPIRSPFNRPGPSTPSRFTSPAVPCPIVPSATMTSPVVRPYQPQRAFRSTAPGASPFRPHQPQNTIRPSPLTSPTVQRQRAPAPQSVFRPSTSRPPAPTPQRSPMPRTPFRAPVPTPSTIRPTRPPPPRMPAAPQVQARLPFGNQVQRPFNLSKPSNPQPPLPSPPASQKSKDSWDDDIVFTDMSNLALQTPQAQKAPANQDDGHDSFDDEIFILEDPAPSTSAASHKRPATSPNAVPTVKRTKSAAEELEEFQFSDSDFD
uniref:CBFD_NFYB_HMF domain-containing protein n=1 Tax=Panagrellus redivivus TaxID=6233 RepID=A0A7E4V4C0_PANRE